MSDFVSGLYSWLVERFQRKLDSTPQRDWSQIGWLHRAGRLLLIVLVLGLVLGPVGWLLFR
jgi:hypothetical protein